MRASASSSRATSPTRRTASGPPAPHGAIGGPPSTPSRGRSTRHRSPVDPGGRVTPRRCPRPGLGGHRAAGWRHDERPRAPVGAGGGERDLPAGPDPHVSPRRSGAGAAGRRWPARGVVGRGPQGARPGAAVRAPAPTSPRAPCSDAPVTPDQESRAAPPPASRTAGPPRPRQRGRRRPARPMSSGCPRPHLRRAAAPTRRAP